MKPILDQFILSSGPFRPKTANELVAFRLAMKLGDVSATRHYVALADSRPQGQLLCAYRRAVLSSRNGDLGRRFHAELERIHSNGNHDHHLKLVSIRVERRAVAIAIFYGDRLEHTDVKQLSSSHDKALASALGFVNSIVERFPVESATLESIPTGHEFQRRILHNGVWRTLRDLGLPIWEIGKTELFRSFGYPPLRSRNELREVAVSIWPVLEGTRAKVFIQDAAVLGLHIQTERLFIIN